MNRRSVAVTFVSVLALTGLGYSGWRYVAQREHQTCRACSRPVHDHSRTIASINGKRGYYCCPACALSEHQQAGKPVQVTQLTDYMGGGALVPSESYIVQNSDINPCTRHEAVISPDKQPVHAHFDRCSPSILAFRDMKTAQIFVAEHGGQVDRFSDFASAFQR
ncbi:MAG: nitrous oxide reductase accessory protein NosL [Fimbriimonadaceae bacterium]|jgi:hypothetical protein|nr:nitrous oxide reductase accessory protein NosL [Fimbriimonadaceae bacterium]